MRAGWKTTEFWITFVICAVSLLLESGIVVEGSKTDAGIGYIVAGLAAMGYTGVRGGVKKKLEARKDGDSSSTSDDAS